MVKLSRQEQKVRTKKEIMQAAKIVFRKKGIVDAQISDITKEANLAHGTFYVHFESKDKIVEEFLQQFNEEMYLSIAKIWKKTMPKYPALMLHMVIEEYFNIIEKNRELVAILIQKNGMIMPMNWSFQGMNKPAISFLQENIAKIGSIKKKSAKAQELILHSLLGIWSRLGFKFAMEEDQELQKNKEEYMATLRETTLALISHFSPLGAMSFKVKPEKIEKDKKIVFGKI